MPPADEPARQEQRRSKANTGSHNPLPLAPSPSGKSMSSSRTDGYSNEDAPVSPPRPSSAIRYDIQQGMQSPRTTGIQSTATPVPRRQPGMTREFPTRQTRTTAQQQYEQTKSHKNVHWLLPLGVGMVAMLVLWVVGSAVLAWSLQRYDDIRYGNPRTYQTNAVVGHNNDSPAHPSHFIAVNLNRQAIVIELMAGDPAKSVSYVVPYSIYGDGADLTPVTVEFRDVAGHHKPDMIVHIHLRTQDQTFVFVNDGTKFRPPNGNDKIQL